MAALVGPADGGGPVASRQTPVAGPLLLAGARVTPLETDTTYAGRRAVVVRASLLRAVLDITGRGRQKAGCATGPTLVGRTGSPAEEVVRPIPIGPIGPPTLGLDEVLEAVTGAAVVPATPTGRRRVAVPRPVAAP